MCELCDAAAHWSQPFHLRKEWSKGFLRPLPAGSTVSATSEECVFGMSPSALVLLPGVVEIELESHAVVL